MDFSNKIVLVTGGGSGIGRTTCQHFAKAGATVVVSDIDQDGGQATVDLIVAAQDGAGGTASFCVCNVAEEESVKELMEYIKTTYGRLDAAFNNAGIVGKIEHLHLKSLESFEKVISVNLRGVFLCMKHEIALMLEQEEDARRACAIVNSSSTAGLIGEVGIVDYSASKHAVVGMTKVAAAEYAKKGIRINAINPGNVETPMMGKLDEDPDIAPLMGTAVAPSPMGRLGETDEIARAVLFLCSDGIGFLTGASLPIDGGTTAI